MLHFILLQRLFYFIAHANRPVIKYNKCLYLFCCSIYFIAHEIRPLERMSNLIHVVWYQLQVDDTGTAGRYSSETTVASENVAEFDNSKIHDSKQGLVDDHRKTLSLLFCLFVKFPLQ